MKKILLVLLGSLTVATSAQAADPFPRLGGVLIGSPHDYWNSAYLNQIAKLDVAVLNIYPGWGPNYTSMQQVATQMKAINPNSKVFLYVNAHVVRDPTTATWKELHSKIQSQNWWLYKNGKGGTKVASSGAGMYVLNTTTYSPKDSSGKTFGQWYAGWVASKFGKPNPAIAGLYTDNFTWKPIESGDWNRDGTTDSPSSTTVQAWYRQGYRQYMQALNAAMPGEYQITNLADWGHENSNLTEYKDLVNGGVIESIIGRTWSFETRLGFTGMMKAYRRTMGALKAPKLGIFSQTGNPTDYQGFRYGFAACLMDDGYYAFNNINKAYSGVNWFDEFNINLGTATKPPAMTAWQNGVYRRDFQYGIALVNPKGNGTRTVTLEADFKTMKGGQAPSVNTGKVLRTVTLKDRDGIILLRAGAAAKAAPAAPQGFVIESN